MDNKKNDKNNNNNSNAKDSASNKKVEFANELDTNQDKKNCK